MDTKGAPEFWARARDDHNRKLKKLLGMVSCPHSQVIALMPPSLFPAHQQNPGLKLLLGALRIDVTDYSAEQKYFSHSWKIMPILCTVLKQLRLLVAPEQDEQYVLPTNYGMY